MQVLIDTHFWLNRMLPFRKEIFEMYFMANSQQAVHHV